MEEGHATRTSRPTVPSGGRSGSSLVGMLVLILVVGAGAFVAGMQYQKGHSSTVATSGVGTTTGAGRFGGGHAMNGGFGMVTAISASSISVQDRRTGTTKTYSITSSTTITDNGSATTYSGISAGDSVLITTASSTSTVATKIIVNPSFGGGPGGQAGSSASATN